MDLSTLFKYWLVFYFLNQIDSAKTIKRNVQD